jgi:hypothetical protein
LEKLEQAVGKPPAPAGSKAGATRNGVASLPDDGKKGRQKGDGDGFTWRVKSPDDEIHFVFVSFRVFRGFNRDF